MIEHVIARRYAKALAAAAAEKDKIESTALDVQRLADMLDAEEGDISVPELMDFLTSPLESSENKIKITDKICQKLNIGDLVSDFLNVLIRRRRVPLMGKIAQAFLLEASAHDKILTAEVTTASKLAAKQQATLSGALEKVCGQKVRLSLKEDGSLISGVRVKLGDVLYDGSFKARLARLADSLTG